MTGKEGPRTPAEPDRPSPAGDTEASGSFGQGFVRGPIHPDGDHKASALGVDEGLSLLVFMASTFFLMSFWLHFPGMNPNVYSDLMDILWPRILHSPGIVPYVSYNLEYPAISAAVLYVSSVWRNVYAFYLSISAILFGCMLGALYLVYRALKEREEPTQRIAYFVVFTPSFIYFSIYSFDWIGAFFMVAAVYFGYKRRALKSGVSIGLATAARVIPIVCLPFLFFEFKGRRNRTLLLLSAGGAWLAANLYFILAGFKGFLYPYQYQAGFYAEDSWLGLFSPYSRDVSALLLGVALGLVLYRRRKFNIFQQTLLAMLAFVVFSYKFPPQYMILLLPLFALTGVSYREFMLVNILDVTLILWYFTPLFNLGAPLALGGPVQWVGYLRQYVLFLVFAKMMLGGAKKGQKPIESRVTLEEKVPIVGRFWRHPQQTDLSRLQGPESEETRRHAIR